MLALFLLYLVIPGAQVLYFAAHQPLLSVPVVLDFSAAILSYHWILANILTASKLPLLQRHFPYDARIRFHIVATLGLVVALTYHALFKILGGKSIDLITWTLLGVILLFLLTSVVWIPVPGFASARRWFRSIKIPGITHAYDGGKQWHRFLVLFLTALVGLHVAESSFIQDPAQNGAIVPLLVAVLYFLAAFASLVLIRLGAFRVTATLAGVEEQQGILNLKLATRRPLKYHSGQFCFVQAKVGGRKEEHPFSFLSVPGDSHTSFAVRMVGDFTQGLSKLPPGTRLRLRGGFGGFHPRQKDRAWCLIGGGIGSVPFVSVAKDLARQNDPRPLILVLSVRSEKEIPDLEELKRLEADRPHFKLKILVTSQTPVRLSREYLAEQVPELEKYTFAVCASPGVQRVVLTSLKELGVKPSHIRTESFDFAPGLG